jgi:tetratricopeptide (TPR) repeat protein/transcriptional regulator with XRE-family HTH domain
MSNGGKPSVNSRLREARLERGWSQQELADLVGTTPVNVSRWENGSNFPVPYYRQKLSEALGKTLAELDLLSSSPPQDVVTKPPELVLLPSLPVSRVVNIPVTRNPYFTGRQQLLESLHDRLSTAKMAALTQAQALYGLGGVGKTQTAVEYAYRHGDDYTHVFWVLAATRDTLVAGFVKLAELLDLREKDEQDQQRIVAAVKHWLTAHDGWLLILDNADDLPLARQFLPSHHKGYVLFTTRAQASGTIASNIEVEQLGLQEGSLLLLRCTKLLDMDSTLDQAQPADRAAAERIVKEMDGLPLAIVQAGAYIEETGCSLEAYLSLYAAHRKDLLARPSRLLLDYPKTVATTWAISFEQVKQESAAAADLLCLCAFLAPDAIPEEMVMRGSAELGPILGAAVADAFEFNAALEVLRRYSLVRRNASTQMLNIHRLVQTVHRDSMDQETQRVWAERTVRALSAAFPEIDYGTDKNHQYYLQYYLPQVQECAALITQYDFRFPEAARLLYQAGVFLYYHGFQMQSQSLHQQALTIRKQIFGSDHPTVAESFNSLGMLARNQGDFEQAEGFHQQALAIREKMLGPDDPATAESLNNLGVLYRNQGKYDQAEPLLQRALRIREQMLGLEHPYTLMTLTNLGKLYLEQRKYDQADQLLQQALTTSERVLKPEHTLIAQSLDLLARLSFEQGNHETAEAFWKQSLAILEKTLGPEHPATAERLDELAELYYAQGRNAEAQSLCQRALSIGEKILGLEHSNTIAYRIHLAKILSKRAAGQNDDQHSARP